MSDIVKVAEERGELMQDVDGFFYYFPKGSGSIPAYQLRQLADELDRRNAPWEKQINEYFDKQSK
jgi:hypothetical protein